MWLVLVFVLVVFVVVAAAVPRNYIYNRIFSIPMAYKQDKYSSEVYT
jgi:hypothetical protein